MDIKELRNLILEEKIRTKMNEGDTTSPGTPLAKQGLKRKEPVKGYDTGEEGDLPPELQKPYDPTEFGGGEPGTDDEGESTATQTQPAKGLNPQLQALLNNPQFISALKAKLGLK